MRRKLSGREEELRFMDHAAYDPNHIAAFLIPMTFFALIATVVLIVPFWFIFKKAGFSPWLAILTFVPLANVIILYVVAFSEWKVVPVPPYSVTQHPHQPYPPQI